MKKITLSILLFLTVFTSGVFAASILESSNITTNSATLKANDSLYFKYGTSSTLSSSTKTSVKEISFSNSLTKLTPNTKYYYRSCDNNGCGVIQSFTTAKEIEKEPPKEETVPPPPGERWKMPSRLTWYWQLQGTIKNEPVEAYDIDGFENTAAEVATLHLEGKHAICYIDVGTAENFRPDYSSFPSSVLGNTNGWPGERWLDVRQLSTLEPIMTKRFQMCKEKGFDALEPDNMDGYENNTGFPITAQQQLTYDEWVSTEAHLLGLDVFQKNDGEQTKELLPYFDGAITEECNVYKECSSFEPYVTNGKPVLNAEYKLIKNSFCSNDESLGIMGARFDLELDGKLFEPCFNL